MPELAGTLLAVHWADRHPDRALGIVGVDGPCLARNPNLKISARVASDHGKILRNDSPTVANAVREITALLDHKAS